MGNLKLVLSAILIGVVFGLLSAGYFAFQPMERVTVDRLPEPLADHLREPDIYMRVESEGRDITLIFYRTSQKESFLETTFEYSAGKIGPTGYVLKSWKIRQGVLVLYWQKDFVGIVIASLFSGFLGFLISGLILLVSKTN